MRFGSVVSLLTIVIIGLGIQGCASMAFLWGGETDNTALGESASRGLASEDSQINGIDNTRDVETEVVDSVKRETESEKFGDTVSSNEFSNLSRRSSDSARRGYKRKASVWDGVENVGEGSLWNPDNQSNFYFSRNLLYSVGDLITLDIDPEMSESLNSRLTALYRPFIKAPPQDVVAREVSGEAGKKVEEVIGNAVKNDAIGAAMGEAVKEKTEQTLAAPKRRYFTTKDVTLRVIEVTPRGLLKLEGSKKLFLRNAAFDLKVAGMVRETDITSSKRIASSQLMDQKVEIVK